MLRLLYIFVLTFLLFSNAYAGRTVFKNGNIYEGQVKWKTSFKVDLPPGKWKQIDRWEWYWRSIYARGVSLIQEDDGKAVAFYEIYEINTAGKYIYALNSWLQRIFFKGKHDGCYQRPEYYLQMRWKKGASFNCFNVRHFDTVKRFETPDEQWQEVADAGWKKYFRENSTIVPNIMLSRWSDFYSPTVQGSVLGTGYMIDPEYFGGPQSKFITEDTSEYHRANINNHPKHKKYMEDFVSSAALEHIKFEDSVRARKKHKLNFSMINMKEVNSTSTVSENNSDISSQILSLTELYKSGALTKVEFDKAMKNILN